ncbi:hypothetical protein ACFFV8_06310 [Sphingobium indicum]|uniref:hypothetical protein n=1 Tax=Sphingobium TaxID=165695 RepID=UPI0012683FDA|nr:hypothetical protein [Sphingobium sp. HDIP04]
MKYGEAFGKLGYNLRLPRLHWSAAAEHGVCVTLWHCEIDWPTLSLNSLLNCGPIENWNAAGKNKREEHFRMAARNFDNWLDAIVVKGVPGQGVESASPWVVKERKGLRWRLMAFDETTGHFELKALSYL